MEKISEKKTLSLNLSRNRIEEMKEKMKISLSKKDFRPVLNEIISKFPKIFDKKQPLPLKIGIDFDIHALMPHVSRNLINRSLRYWTNSHKYLCSIVSFDKRFDINGVALEDVTAEQKRKAKTKMHEQDVARGLKSPHKANLINKTRNFGSTRHQFSVSQLNDNVKK